MIYIYFYISKFLPSSVSFLSPKEADINSEVEKN